MQQVAALQAVEMYGVSIDKTKHRLIAYCTGRADSNSPVRLPCLLSSHAKDMLSLVQLNAAPAAVHVDMQCKAGLPAIYLQLLHRMFSIDIET